MLLTSGLNIKRDVFPFFGNPPLSSYHVCYTQKKTNNFVDVRF